MPIGNVLDGSSWNVLVGTVNPPTTPVGALTGFDYPSEAAANKRDYYGTPTFFARGKKSGTFTFTMDAMSGDSGQQILLNAWITGNTIYAMLKQDLTNGETLPVKVTARPISGSDPNNPTAYSITLSQASDAIVVAGGFGA